MFNHCTELGNKSILCLKSTKFYDDSIFHYSLELVLVLYPSLYLNFHQNGHLTPFDGTILFYIQKQIK